MGKILLSFCTCLVPMHCGSSPIPKPTKANASTPKIHDLYMDSTLADGFDYPFGDGNGGGDYIDKATGLKHSGWYIATKTTEVYALGVHTGEDWNGKGGGNTDLGQVVCTTGKGLVKAAQDFGVPWGNIIVIEHRFIENNKVDTIYSVYMHLATISVKENDLLNKRQLIGTIGDGSGS
ncbi:MAG: M23 family metallopeptidase [Bacteroidota bacterium]|nr:M23 family metallopeptidase [Bacteroidota bacterium]